MAGAEEGCCGISGILISFVAFDGGPSPKHDSSAGKLRRATHFVSIIFMFPIIVALCSSISICTAASSWETQKSSIFALYPCLMINIYAMVHNVAEASAGLW
jgi:hypothetical protein